jgi:hypothetical protein
LSSPPNKQLGFPEAIEAAAVASEGGGWMGAAIAALVAVAGAEDRFTADEVWLELERRGCTLEPGDARAMGGAFRRAARKGWVRRLAGEYRVSVRKGRHGGPVQVWESGIVTSGRSAEPK